MKVLKTIGNCCLVFLAIISVCISLIYAYWFYFVDIKTTGTNYITDQIPIDFAKKKEDLSEEQIDYYENRYLFNINYFSNNKENGIELQEMQLNHFTDYTLTYSTCRGSGIQFLGNFVGSSGQIQDKEEAEQFTMSSSNMYYYDTWDMLSYDGGNLNTQFNRDTLFIIKIGDKPFLIQLTGQYREWIYRSKTAFGKWIGADSYIDHYYTWGAVFQDLFSAISNCSYGYGDFYLNINLSKYFTVYEFDIESKQWSKDNISDQIFTYAIIKVHYDENGAVNSNQSIFGLVAGNKNYGLNNNIDTTYWQEKYIYTIGYKDFNYRYSDTYNGYFVSLNVDVISALKNSSRTLINVDIVLSSIAQNEHNVVGIDYNGFENLPINILTISGEKQDFYVLDNALNNTQLNILKRSEKINLKMSENAINNSSYVEVII